MIYFSRSLVISLLSGLTFHHDRSTIKRLVKMFESTGTVQNISVRQTSAASAAIEEDLNQSLKRWAPL